MYHWESLSHGSSEPDSSSAGSHSQEKTQTIHTKVEWDIKGLVFFHEKYQEHGAI